MSDLPPEVEILALNWAEVVRARLGSGPMSMESLIAAFVAEATNAWIQTQNDCMRPVPGRKGVLMLRESLQGTWVHPQVATHLAQWLSPRFAVLVSKWVVDWMSGGVAQKRAELPYHLRRHIANQNQVPAGHFSMLSEVMISIIGPMEAMGYTLPERMLPDISMGKMFCAFLRSHRNVDTTKLPKYIHIFEDGRQVSANAYPDELLADFRKHLREVWLAKHAIPYFRPRDSEALPYLTRLLKGPSGPKPKQIH